MIDDDSSEQTSPLEEMRQAVKRRALEPHCQRIKELEEKLARLQVKQHRAQVNSLAHQLEHPFSVVGSNIHSAAVDSIQREIAHIESELAKVQEQLQSAIVAFDVGHKKKRFKYC